MRFDTMIRLYELNNKAIIQALSKIGGKIDERYRKQYRQMVWCRTCGQHYSERCSYCGADLLDQYSLTDVTTAIITRCKACGEKQ